MIKRLTWRRNKPATGLMRIGQGELGHKLYQGDLELASVSAHSFRHPHKRGYYWVAFGNKELGIEHHNTASETPLETVEEAKKAARAYIEEALRRDS